MPKVQTKTSVVSLAGRRVDAEGINPRRFPLANVPIVRKRLAELLAVEDATAIVCSAACGADLIALEEAERRGIQRRVVLPFGPDRFRERSVVDRPGDWGSIFDRLIATAATSGDLVVLDRADDDDDAAYAAANEAIIREASSLAQADTPPRRRLAVVVWEGAARAGNDATETFRDLASKAGFDQRSVRTL